MQNHLHRTLRSRNSQFWKISSGFIPLPHANFCSHDTDSMAPTISTSLVAQPQAVPAMHQHSPASPDTPRFTCFGKLPAEIKIMVWSFATAEPQLVFVESKWFLKGHGRSQLMTTHIPAVLHACIDSRKMGLKTYKLCLSNLFIHPIYFDERKDTLAFRTAEAWEGFLCTFHSYKGTPLEPRFDLWCLWKLLWTLISQRICGDFFVDMFRNCRNLETFLIKAPEALLDDVHGVLKKRQIEEFNLFCDSWRDWISELELLPHGDENKVNIAAFPKLIPLSREEILEKFPSARQPGKPISDLSRHAAHRADLCRPPTPVEFIRPHPEPCGDDKLDELIRLDYDVQLDEHQRRHLWHATLWDLSQALLGYISFNFVARWALACLGASSASEIWLWERHFHLESRESY